MHSMHTRKKRKADTNTATAETPAVDTSPDTPIAEKAKNTAAAKTPAIDALPDTPAIDALPDTPAIDALPDTPASNASPDTPARDASLDAPAHDALLDAPACDTRDSRPAAVIRAWQPKLDDQYAMESAANAALELLILMILQELDAVLTSTNNTPARKSEILVPTITSMLLIQRSQKANYLQKMISLYLFSAGCPSKAVEVFKEIGLAVARPTLMRALTTLAALSSKEVQTLALKHLFVVVYDNVNRADKKEHQRLDNKDEFCNGTMATVVIKETAMEPALQSNASRHLCLNNILPTWENEHHHQQVFGFHLLDVLT
ncbi:MAG: hypothetical protein BYD32DRAFT_461731 [Podila humilis]|nr:MAG: hypothetical protein BYD32DRAFT_461731 [Podila humilis]